MKKYSFILLSLLILSTPLIYWKILNSMIIDPENHQVITEFPVYEEVVKEEISSENAKLALETNDFLTGYWDGQNKKWHGSIHWSTNPEYRRGHMLGSFDKKHKIERYDKID